MTPNLWLARINNIDRQFRFSRVYHILTCFTFGSSIPISALTAVSINAVTAGGSIFTWVGGTLIYICWKKLKEFYRMSCQKEAFENRYIVFILESHNTTLLKHHWFLPGKSFTYIILESWNTWDRNNEGTVITTAYIIFSI